MSQWLVLHLTDRCPRSCVHCLRERGARPTDLSLAVIEKVLDEVGPLHGVSHVGLTGGEPLAHPRFEGVLDAIAGRGFTWHAVTSGSGFARLLAALDAVPARRAALRAIDVSLDGSSERTHDAVRGAGSHREALAAIAACSARAIPFTVQATLHARNVDELEELGLLAAQLGARAVGFAMMNATGRETDDALALPPAAWARVRDRIERLAAVLKLPVTAAEGFPRGDRFHVCEPFRSEVLHVTPRGELSLCCNLSGAPGDGRDVVCDLSTTSLAEGHRRLLELVHRLQRERLDAIAARAAEPGWDGFPCNRCRARFGAPHWRTPDSAEARARSTAGSC